MNHTVQVLCKKVVYANATYICHIYILEIQCWIAHNMRVLERVLKIIILCQMLKRIWLKLKLKYVQWAKVLTYILIYDNIPHFCHLFLHNIFCWSSNVARQINKTGLNSHTVNKKYNSTVSKFHKLANFQIKGNHTIV